MDKRPDDVSDDVSYAGTENLTKQYRIHGMGDRLFFAESERPLERRHLNYGM
jgi:hypothetical protein